MDSESEGVEYSLLKIVSIILQAKYEAKILCSLVI